MLDLDFKSRSLGFGLLRISKSILCSGYSLLPQGSLTPSSVMTSLLFHILPYNFSAAVTRIHTKEPEERGDVGYPVMAQWVENLP